MAEPNPDGISIFGDQFVARIDFSKPLADAKLLDQRIQASQASLERFVSNGTSRLAALAAGFDRVAASVGRANTAMATGSGVGVLGGVTGGAVVTGRQPRQGRVDHPQAPVLFGAGDRTRHPRATTGTDWNRYPGPVADRFWGGIPVNASNQQVLRNMGLLPGPIQPPFGGGGGGYNSGPMGQNWGYWGSSGPPAYIPPGGPAASFANRPIAALPAPVTDVPWRDVTPRSGRGGFWGFPISGGLPGPAPWERTFARGSTRVGRTLSAPARLFTPANLMAAASSMYIAQRFASVGRYAADATIGEAMREQEARELLGNTLTSPKMGLDINTADSFADDLVEARYLAGIGTSTAALGLSRTDLAEQYRTLAPLVRLSAEDASQFRTGLQTGSFARQLLVARDPVQGTKGAMVALSELYAGGPDRFRSLSLRFELPRSRLLEIEKEMESQGGYFDPGEIAIKMLTEMGFGPEYLERRAEKTLPGQLGRTGALWDNFKIDIFQSSLTNVISNMDRLNDAVEAWANSPAYDEAIAAMDNFFGRAFEIITGPITNYVSGSLMRNGGAMDPFNFGNDIADFARYAGGQFLDKDGKPISPAQARAEAARTTGQNYLEALTTAPQYNTGSAAASQAAMWGVGLLSGGAIADRYLMGNSLSGGLSALRSGAGIQTAGRMALGGLASPAMLALSGAMAAGTTIASFRQSGQSMRTIDMLNAMDYESSLDTGLFSPGRKLDSEGVAGVAMRLGRGNAIQRAAGRSAMFMSNLGTQVGNAFGLAPAMGLWELESAGQFVSEDASVAGATSALRQSIFSGVEDPNSVTPDVAMRQGYQMLQQIKAENPEKYRFTSQQEAQIVQGLVEPGVNPSRYAAQALLGRTIQQRAIYGRGMDVDNGDPTGVLGFTADESTDYLDPASQRLLMSEIMQRYEGDEDTLLKILEEIWGETERIGDNTESADETLKKATGLNRVQLSKAPGLFYGFDPNPDQRNVGPGGHYQFSSPADAETGAHRHSDGSVADGPNGLFNMGDSGVSTLPGESYNNLRVGGGTLTGEHSGVDLIFGKRGVGGDPVLNPFDGGATVVDKGFNEQGLGNYVHLRTKTGRIVRMGHFQDSVPWEKGDRIPQGETIGLEGSTGLSSGPHVHMDYLGAGKENRDYQLFRQYYMEDTGTLPGEMGQGGGPSTGAGVHLEVHLNGSFNGSPEENARAIRSELDRWAKDGELARALDHVTFMRRRQGAE